MTTRQMSVMIGTAALAVAFGLAMQDRVQAAPSDTRIALKHSVSTEYTLTNNTVVLGAGGRKVKSGGTLAALETDPNWAAWTNLNNVALGAGVLPNANPTHLTVAVGAGALVGSSRQTAIGHNAKANSGTRAVSIGSESVATGVYSIAVGYTAVARQQSSLAMGFGATAGDRSIAIGSSVTSTGGYNVVIGQNSTATSSDAVVIGYGSAGGISAVAVGEDAEATQNGSVAVGDGTRATGVVSTAVGHLARAACRDAIAIGDAAVVSGTNAVQFGEGENSTANTMRFRTWNFLDHTAGTFKGKAGGVGMSITQVFTDKNSILWTNVFQGGILTTCSSNGVSL